MLAAFQGLNQGGGNGDSRGQLLFFFFFYVCGLPRVWNPFLGEDSTTLWVIAGDRVFLLLEKVVRWQGQMLSQSPLQLRGACDRGQSIRSSFPRLWTVADKAQGEAVETPFSQQQQWQKQLQVWGQWQGQCKVASVFFSCSRGVTVSQS